MTTTNKRINDSSIFSTFLLFFATNFATNGAISSIVSNMVKELCQGGDGQMYGNQMFVSLPENSCCKSCELDQICIERKTCCDDRWQLIKNFAAKVCLPGRKVHNMKRSVNMLNINYLVRAHCPSNFSNDDIRNKCENEEPSTLEDVPFVSPRKGDVIYKNRYCAICHGETNPIVWNLQIDHTCIKRVFLLKYYSGPVQNASIINKNLIDSCEMYFERPDKTQTNWKRLMCAVDAKFVSDCPEKPSSILPTGRIKEELNDLCLNDKSGLSVSKVLNKQYSNVYCYLCNTPMGEKCFYNIPDKVVPSLSMVLDLSPLRTGLSPKQQQTQCNDDHFYDEFFEKCRQIKCPMFEIAAAGKCVSFVKRSKLNYAFNFEVLPTQAVNTSSLKRISQALSVSLRFKLGFKRCTVCSINMPYKLPENTSDGQEYVKLYAHIVFTTSSSCELKYLLSLAEQLRQTRQLSLLLWNVTYMTTYFSNPQEYVTLTHTLPAIYKQNRCAFYYPDRFNCPWMTLSLPEMTELRNRTGNSTTLETRQSEDGYFELCISTYQKLIRDSKSCSSQIKLFTGARMMFIALFGVIMLKDVDM